MINIIKNRLPVAAWLPVWIATLTCLLILFSPALQAEFFTSSESPQQRHARASEQMQFGNFAIAYCIWQPMAEADDPAAQYNLGWMYHNGYGLTIDDETAFYWWIKSAAAGNVDAEYALGDLYLQGLGVEKDLFIALGWYISAALKGHEPARETLLTLLTEQHPKTMGMFKILLRSDWSILGQPMQVRVDKANTRNGPGKQFKVITTLQHGHRVIPIRQQDSWTQVGITGLGKTAWIFSRLLGKIEAPPAEAS